jgi:hypothetical protein
MVANTKKDDANMKKRERACRGAGEIALPALADLIPMSQAECA